MQYDDCITNPRWRTDAILKNHFWLYLGAIGLLTDQREFWNGDEESHADIGHVTKTAIFADGRHFQNSFISISQQRIIPFRPNLVRRCISHFPGWTFNEKSKFCKFKMADERHIENRICAIIFSAI